jgi:hypothetical protein
MGGCLSLLRWSFRQLEVIYTNEHVIIRVSIHPSIHPYIHTYIHTYIRTYVHEHSSNHPSSVCTHRISQNIQVKALSLLLLVQTGVCVRGTPSVQ